MKVNFSQKEKELLDAYHIQYDDALSNEEADNLINKLADTLQGLNASQRNLAEDIITKITMHPDW